MPLVTTSPHRAPRKQQIRLSLGPTRRMWPHGNGRHDNDGGRVTTTRPPAIGFRPPGRTSTNVGEAGSVQVQIHKFISCLCVGAIIAYRQQTKIRILFPCSAVCTCITASFPSTAVAVAKNTPCSVR
jgi:hypothetical protein